MRQETQTRARKRKGGHEKQQLGGKETKEKKNQMKRWAGEEGQRQVERSPLENERPKRMDKGNATKHTIYIHFFNF